MGTLMKSHAWAIASLAMLLPPAFAAEPSGAAMAATCGGCHGTHGKLELREFVPLAGMRESEFVRAMREFRAGTRPSTLMGHVANGFTDGEIEAMARYFATIPTGMAPRRTER